MILLLLTILAFGAGLALGHALRFTGFPSRILFAGTFIAAEIVVIETLLGATGFLYSSILIVASVSISALTLLFSLRALGKRWVEAIYVDLRSLRNSLALLRHPEIAIFSALAALVGLWTFLTIMYLPPRSVDDLCHHLFPVFETAVRGHFVLLPLDFRPWFAYPLNADLLFLWPTVLQGDIQWVEAAQGIAALLAAIAIAALAREMRASPRHAALGAVLFLLIPLTAKQASSCYTDLILAAFYGAALYGALRYAKDGSTGSLLLAGLGCGLLAGTKYNFLFPLFALIPLVLVGMMKGGTPRSRWKQIALFFVLPSAGLCIYWYLRNLILLGNPMYPFQVGMGPVILFDSALPPDNVLLGSSSYISMIFDKPSMIFELFFGDIGLGGIDGGFGSLFWAGVIPVGFVYLFARVMRIRRDRDLIPLLFALQFCAALFPYMIVQKAASAVSIRFLLAAAVPGIAILVLSFQHLRETRPVLSVVVTLFMIIAAALPLSSLAGSTDITERKQAMTLDERAQAAREGFHGSPWHFAHHASYNIGLFAQAWEMLDSLSPSSDTSQHPLWVFATGGFPAGYYGTQLQNRLWNLDAPDRPEKPDILCYYLEKDGRIISYGDRIVRFEEVNARPDEFELVLNAKRMLVYVRRELIAPGTELRERCASFYEHTMKDDVAAARTLDPHPEGGVIFVALSLGHGLKALEFRGELTSRVILCRPEDSVHLAPLFASNERVLFVKRKENVREGIVGRFMGTEDDIVLADVTADCASLPIQEACEDILEGEEP